MFFCSTVSYWNLPESVEEAYYVADIYYAKCACVLVALRMLEPEIGKGRRVKITIVRTFHFRSRGEYVECQIIYGVIVSASCV